MVKITNQKALELDAAFKGFERLKQAVPFKLSYAVSKHKNTIEQHAKDFNDARIALCEEYCIKDKEGKSVLKPSKTIFEADGKPAMDYQFTDESLKLITEKVAELAQEEVEVPEYKVDFMSIEKAEFAPTAIPYFITFVEYITI